MYVQPLIQFPRPARDDARTVRAYIFRDALLCPLPDIQAAEVYSYCEVNAIFQTPRESFHGTPLYLREMWKAGCRGGYDIAIILLDEPLGRENLPANASAFGQAC